MTTVRAQCPACGDVQLQIDDLTVRVCSDEDDAERVPLPVPGMRADGAPRGEPADRRPARVGRRAARAWRWPAELAEPPAGPPLTPDDLLDLHVLLEDDNWFEQLVALVRRTTPE